MGIGLMNVPFLLQACRVVDDGEGGSVQQWYTIAALWGSLSPYRLHKDPLAEANVTHEVTTRARIDLEMDVGQRLTYKDRIYLIVSVMAEGPRQNLRRLLVCENQYLN